MSRAEPRRRVVYFRVSESEFHELEQACQTVGARNISELARTAIKHLLEYAPHPYSQSIDAVVSLQKMLDEMNAHLRRLIALMELSALDRH